MKFQSRNKSRCISAASSFAMLCFCLLSSCGLGTEVGNGAKDKGTKGKKGTQANNEMGSNDGEDVSNKADSEPLKQKKP